MSSLAGKRVVVTRAPHQAGELVDLLVARGATALLYPCIDIVLPDDTSALDAALHRLAEFDWLILTSLNTVYALSQRLAALKIEQPARLSVAAIGPATAAAIETMLGFQVKVVAAEYIAESLSQAIPQPYGKRILLPQSAIAREVLADTLSDAGAQVEVIPAYRTVIGSGGVDLPALLAAQQVDAITLTSSSTVTHLLKRLTVEGGQIALLNQVLLACIGRVTAETAHEHGLTHTLIPHSYTLDGMIAAMEHYFTENSS